MGKSTGADTHIVSLIVDAVQHVKVMDKFLIEVSFEAGNKVGGIWTVLTSKSSYMKKQFGGNKAKGNRHSRCTILPFMGRHG